MSGKPKEPLTTEQKAQVATLSAAGWSQNAVARSIGKSRHAVKNALAAPEVQAAVHDEKQELAEIFKGKARAIVTSIDADVIDKGNLLQRATASAICLDKSLLLSGEPTSVINIQVLHDVIALIREKRDREDQGEQEKWEQAHALPSPAAVQHILPAPSAEPAAVPTPARATAPIPASAPLLPNQSTPPAAGMRITYRTPTEVEHQDESGPLMHGLFNPDK